MQKNIADIPLHYGKAPKWLFERQKKILFEIARVVIYEFGSLELLRRLSDPVWFQILGCISGFDWHSSGVTTTVTAALKEAFSDKPEFGIYIFGGKGQTAIDTPNQILRCKNLSQHEKFIKISKLTAKVDNSCIQDGYQLYHHVIFIDNKDNWTVIQQGLNKNNRYARRYHWFNRTTSYSQNSLIIEPHSAVISQTKESNVLNFVAEESKEFQKNILEYFKIEKPQEVLKVYKKIVMPQRHQIYEEDYNLDKLYKIFVKLKNKEINTFEEFILTNGVGAKTLRAMSLISEVIYGNFVAIKDPARFSFAFGGKDGIPYPVDKKNFDLTISLFKDLVDKACLGDKEKLNAFKKLSYFNQYSC